MAGSFGPEQEHYERSQSIGARQLFPAIDRAQDVIVVAPDVSRYQQPVWQGQVERF